MKTRKELLAIAMTRKYMFKKLVRLAFTSSMTRPFHPVVDSPPLSKLRFGKHA
jgi:hypothetical protein